MFPFRGSSEFRGEARILTAFEACFQGLDATSEVIHLGLEARFTLEIYYDRDLLIGHADVEAMPMPTPEYSDEEDRE